MTEAAAAYDDIAHRYDRLTVENRINRHMRRVSRSKLAATFAHGMRVLEVGCGTGEEAAFLASRGVRVTALDPSEGMLAMAKQRASDLGVEDRVTFLRGLARDLDRLVPRGSTPFDGAYASFSLAYERSLRPVAAALHPLLRHDARFLLTVPARLCLTEAVLALLTARPHYAGRRLRAWHGHKVGRHRVPIRTFTPASLRDELAPYFSILRMEALPAVVPPAYVNRYYARFEGLATALEALDDRVRSQTPLRWFGDHHLVEARRAVPPAGRSIGTGSRDRSAP